jgi:Rrf2 family nitric oxide-sensitive transcriptional repressor
MLRKVSLALPSVSNVRLTQFSDYALRTVLYLGAHPEAVIPVADIAQSYGISYHHLTKVAARLCEIGVTEAVRGRRGGLRLITTPATLNVGWLVRQTEPDFALVECFDAATDQCPITPACTLRSVLHDALAQFLAVLDQYTLADFLRNAPRRQELIRLWRAS